ncbi:MAG: hypothetical protein LBP85_03330 [Prevotellaceae bacterium]|jgi:hypothetical protein|nr:hypothetical protein [Prevotellaceae bacterium]
MKAFLKISVLSCCLMILCTKLVTQSYGQNIVGEIFKTVGQFKQNITNSIRNYANSLKWKITATQEKIYELQIQDMITVDLPDEQACLSVIDLFREECSKYLEKVKKKAERNLKETEKNLNNAPKEGKEGKNAIRKIRNLIDKIKMQQTLEELIKSGAIRYNPKPNPSYSPKPPDEENDPPQLRTYIGKNTTDIIKDNKNIGIAGKERNEKKEKTVLANNLSENNDTKKITDSDIRDITETCLSKKTYSSLCDCFRNHYQSATGKDKMRLNPKEKDVKEYNDFLEKVSEISASMHQELKYAEIAMLANHAYNPTKPLADGWELITSENLKNIDETVINLFLEKYNKKEDGSQYDGFNAQIYYNDKTNEYVLSFRGSEFPTKDMLDWVTNYSQAIGSDEYRKQYVKAQNLALILQKTCKDCKISITGHSLGGGLASAAGLVTGLPTYTFNAAGLHKNTVDDFDNKVKNSNIKAYYSDDDILSQAQYGRYSDIVLSNPKVAGAIVGAELLGGKGTIKNIVDKGGKGLIEGARGGSGKQAALTGLTRLIQGIKQESSTRTGLVAGAVAGKLIELSAEFSNSESETVKGEILRLIEVAAEAGINAITNELEDIMEQFHLPSAVGERIKIGTTGQGHFMDGHFMDGIEDKLKKEKELFERNVDLQQQLKDCMI